MSSTASAQSASCWVSASPLTKAAEAALRENTAVIRENTIRRFQGFQGIGGAESAADIIRREIASPSGQALIPKTQVGGDEGRAARLGIVDDLAKLGLSFVDLQRIAQEFGITILEKGKLVGAALVQLTQEIDAVAKSIPPLSTDPAAERARLEIEDRLRIGGRSADPQVAALERERQVQLDALHLSDAEEARIRALNLETAKGRAEFLKFEQDRARRAEGEKLTRAELGAFQTPDALIQALGLGAESVNAFTDSIHAVTDQTANIPRSFKQFAAASAAEIAGLGPNVPIPETRRLRGTDINIPVDIPRRGEGASLPDFIAALRESTRTIKAVKEKPAPIAGNSITITIPGFHGDIRELAREVARQLREAGTADVSAPELPGF